MFLVVGVSMIIDLKCVCMRIMCVCVEYLSTSECVCFLWYQSCFAYNYYTHLLLFFAFLYPRNP